MTTRELIVNIIARMEEVDELVASRTRSRPHNAEDYRALWRGVAHELALADDDE